MRPALLSLLGLLLIAPTADASGVFLKWNACHADGGVSARAFACDTNSGLETLVGSVVLDAALVDVDGIEVRVVGQSANNALPAWWQFQNAGTCRQTAATIQASLAEPVAACPGLFGADAVGGFVYTTNVPSSGGIMLKAAVAVPTTSAVTAAAGQEYFLFALRLSHAKTVGTGACGGCFDPMCLGLAYLRLVTTDPSQSSWVTITTNFFPVDQGHLVSWQSGAPGGVYAYQVNPPFGHELDYAMTCDFATAARHSTWGAVKALYRP